MDGLVWDYAQMVSATSDDAEHAGIFFCFPFFLSFFLIFCLIVLLMRGHERNNCMRRVQTP